MLFEEFCLPSSDMFLYSDNVETLMNQAWLQTQTQPLLMAVPP